MRTAKFSRFRSAILLGVLITFSQIVFAQENISEKDVRNFHKVNANLFRGGQPSEDGIKELKNLGIKTVINLRGADARAKKEEAWANAAGLKFINIPLSNWFGPKDEKIEKILAEINNPENQPVFVHCKRGSDRTGTVIGVYRITNDGWSAEKVNEEAKELGLGWWQIWMKDFIKDYYRDFSAI